MDSIAQALSINVAQVHFINATTVNPVPTASGRRLLELQVASLHLPLPGCFATMLHSLEVMLLIVQLRSGSNSAGAVPRLRRA